MGVVGAVAALVVVFSCPYNPLLAAVVAVDDNPPPLILLSSTSLEACANGILSSLKTSTAFTLKATTASSVSSVGACDANDLSLLLLFRIVILYNNTCLVVQ